MAQYFGKHRGTVHNIDPLMMGRVEVVVPAFGPESTGWAMPCTPYAGNGVGFLAIPPNGAGVWVEFEGGDANYPIWSGCFWGMGEAAPQPAAPSVKILKTDSIMLKLDDTPGAGGFTLEVNPPAATTPLKIVCNAAGIEISNGVTRINLTPSNVSLING
jgi:hypothetical protein